MNKRRLDIILRTSVDNSVRPWKRIVDVPRSELVFKCFKSLINSINEFKEERVHIKLTVLDDHSTEENLNKLKDIAATCSAEVEFISLEHQGYNGPNGSALKQFFTGANCEDLVYMVEDDYFHALNSIRSMFEAWFYFRQKTDLMDVAIYPYDSTHLYEPENKGVHEPTRVFLINDQYWRTANKTANTIFLHSRTLKTYWPLFEKLGIDFPDVTEDDTINRMYGNGVTAGGPIYLFSPMPSLAVHVSYNMPTVINTDFVDWVKKFNELEV